MSSKVAAQTGRPVEPQTTAYSRPGTRLPVIPGNSIWADSRVEGESGRHPPRCLPCSICLGRLSPTCSSRGAGLKSRISSSHQLNVALRRSPHRLRLRRSDRTLLVWMTGSGQACSVCPALFSPTRSCGGIEPGFGPIGVGNLALSQGGPQLAVSCANSHRRPSGHFCVRRQLLWFAVSRHPTAEWLAQ